MSSGLSTPSSPINATRIAAPQLQAHEQLRGGAGELHVTTFLITPYRYQPSFDYLTVRQYKER